MKEHDVHQAVLKHLRSQGHRVLSEYKLNCGRMDMYLPDKGIIIEVKNERSVKHAIGQLIAYKEEVATRLGNPIKKCYVITFVSAAPQPPSRGSQGPHSSRMPVATFSVAQAHGIEIIKYEDIMRAF
jgi:hypothetical protein